MSSRRLVLAVWGAAAVLAATAVSSLAGEPVARIQFGGAPRPGYMDLAPGAAAPASIDVRLSEGTYKVTLTFASKVPAETTVKAESRRLMLEAVRTVPGETVTRSFLVNVRTPKLAGGGAVKLNAREQGSPTWDGYLNLEFLGPEQTVQTLVIERAEKHTTVYIAGDSTVTDQAGEPWAGWGQMLPRFFKDDVAVANHAESGRALRSFRNERRLEKILEAIQPGDYLFIQFGHNDMKEKGEGVGPFTTYAADLAGYVRAAREKGATPVIVTSMHRRRFGANGRVENTFVTMGPAGGPAGGDYIAAARQVAGEEKVPLIDLNAMSARFYEAMGPENSKRAFVHYPAGTYPGQDKPLADNTHHNVYGAYELARCVVEAIRTSDLPLRTSLADDVVPFDPGRPDEVAAVKIPPSLPGGAEGPPGAGKPRTPEGN